MDRWELQGFCHKGHSAIDFVLAILLLELAVLAVHSWLWYRARTAWVEFEPEDKEHIVEVKQ